MADYKAILFDMDGVLIDSEPLFLDAINRIFGFANYDITSVGVWKPWEFADNVTGRVG